MRPKGAPSLRNISVVCNRSGRQPRRLARRRRKRSGHPFPDKDVPVSGVVCRHVPGRDEAGANGMGKAAERMAAPVACCGLRKKNSRFGQIT